LIVTARNPEELKAAMRRGATEIEIQGEALATQLRAIAFIQNRGPVAIGIAVAAIPLIVASGGLATFGLAFAAPGAAWATSAIVALSIAIGGAVVIGLFTNWEHVEIMGVIKLKRKQKS